MEYSTKFQTFGVPLLPLKVEIKLIQETYPKLNPHPNQSILVNVEINKSVSFSVPEVLIIDSSMPALTTSCIDIIMLTKIKAITVNINAS